MGSRSRITTGKSFWRTTGGALALAAEAAEALLCEARSGEVNRTFSQQRQMTTWISSMRWIKGTSATRVVTCLEVPGCKSTQPFSILVAGTEDGWCGARTFSSRRN